MKLTKTTASVFALMTATISLVVFAKPAIAEEMKAVTTEVVDSGARPWYPAGSLHLHWLDDRRILFDGLTGKKFPPRQNGFVDEERAVMIWDTQSNEVKVHALGRLICYFGGLIRYDKLELINGKPVERANGQWAYEQYAGPLGGEKWVEPVANLYLPTCQLFSEIPKLPEWTNDYHIKRLPVIGGGFLLLQKKPLTGPPSVPAKLYLTFSGRADEGIETPMMVSHLPKTTYSNFKKHFLIYDEETNQNLKGKPLSLWTMEPDGKTERVELQYAVRGDGGWYQESRKGLLQISYSSKTYEERSDGGIFLISQTSKTNLFTGSIAPNMAVAAEGCKIAFQSAKSPSELRRGTLKMLNICKGK